MRRAALALATAAPATLALAAPASAATLTFTYTGDSQFWTVPAGVTEANFDLYGAQGGGDPSGVFAAGLGGRATATIAVTRDDLFEVNVGGQGGPPGAGGFNGGGGGSFGGGGASDIRRDGDASASRVLVAGGGGGAGPITCATAGSPEQPVAGGHGGGEVGQPGLASQPVTDCIDSFPGGGAFQTVGGEAESEASQGGFGFGGNGGGDTYIGGGGGGGWWGGGGGLVGAGGGGGSGHGPPGTTFQTGVRSGNGLVTVSYTATLDTLIQSVETLSLPPSLKKSLLQKLNTAKQNSAQACQELAAFITQVQVQSGTKIPGRDADRLIAEAEDVRGPLNCGAGLTCAGQEATIVGTGQRDKLRGTNGDDVIAAQGGNDTVTGLGGDDRVCGAAGDDTLRGNSGGDALRGGGGDDDVRGGGGPDRCRGGTGSDSKRRC